MRDPQETWDLLAHQLNALESLAEQEDWDALRTQVEIFYEEVRNLMRQPPDVALMQTWQPQVPERLARLQALIDKSRHAKKDTQAQLLKMQRGQKLIRRYYQ
ncbi:hypothetical protein SAMN05421831_10233 [Allopseudospirillum japonicum]|uniref:Flagellar protein FliT n=1 Tax=Allopseudospirillum japonicum TaxID=64971 RepID=A0A1H6QXB6_9GAMM|nr:hypothetical protein [Allopseudospirillum japonicum]SEI44837.1 hypothetical protein SAMN05421831_10233 [Allopseudospirillum japonicum]